MSTENAKTHGFDEVLSTDPQNKGGSLAIQQSSVNTRSPELDLMRGFAVLCMILVHCKMTYLDPQFKKHLGAQIIHYLGGAPAAPVFLFLMGYVFALKKSPDWKILFKKSLELLIIGYVLNILRHFLPGFLFAKHLADNLWSGLLMIDILQFAAPALLVLKVCERIPVVILSTLALAIVLCSPYIWGLTQTPHILDFLWGQGDWVFFTFFPWFTYPLVGFIISKLNFAHQKSLFLLGTLLLVASFCLRPFYSSDQFTYYRSSPSLVTWMIGFCLLWLACAKLIVKKLGPPYHLLKFLSENVTSIYFVSWIIISWSTLFIAFKKQTFNQTLLATGLVFLATLLIVHAYKKLKNLL